MNQNIQKKCLTFRRSGVMISDMKKTDEGVMYQR